MVADVLVADEAVDVVFVQCLAHFVAHAREHDVDAFGSARVYQYLEVMQAGGVDEGYFAHAYDAYFGSRFAHCGAHHLVEFCGYAEEEGSVDFVDLYAGSEVEFFVCGEVGVGCGVEFVAVDTDFGVFGHAPEEEHDGEKETDFYCNREVEDDGEQEGDHEHRDVALGVGEDGSYGAPAAHIIRYDNEHGGEGRHGHELYQRHQQEENHQQHDGVDDAGHGGASAVGDVGHGACDGSGDGYAAEEGHYHVGKALADEFGIGVGARAGHAVGNSGRQERLDGA